MSSEKIVSFRDLDTWKAAMDLAVAAHDAASRLPATQRFELGSQIRRSATSVPSNVAEGHAHRGNRTFLRHVRIALGSLAELDTQVELSRRQSLLTDLRRRTSHRWNRANGQTASRTRTSIEATFLPRDCNHRGRRGQRRLAGLAHCQVILIPSPEPRAPSYRREAAIPDGPPLTLIGGP